MAVLEGSWVVISGVISPLIWVIIMVTLLIPPLVTTHEPLSRVRAFSGKSWYVLSRGLRGFMITFKTLNPQSQNPDSTFNPNPKP